jgi:hypothetical protein
VELRRPHLGYVAAPVRVVSLETAEPRPDDVILLSVPGTHHRHADLRALVARRPWRLLREFRHEEALVAVYARG